MSQPTNGQIATGLLAKTVNKLPGTQATIEAAQAYATLAVAEELHAIRTEIQRLAEALTAQSQHPA